MSAIANQFDCSNGLYNPFQLLHFRGDPPVQDPTSGCPFRAYQGYGGSSSIADIAGPTGTPSPVGMGTRRYSDLSRHDRWTLVGVRVVSKSKTRQRGPAKAIR